MYKALALGLLLALTAPVSRAQNQIADEFHADTDPYFQVSEVPDSSGDAAAVIIAYKAEYAYFRAVARGRMYAHRRSTYRSRVKIQNQSALETYSEFTYDPRLGISIRIIKPGGKVIVPDTAESVPLETAGMSSEEEVRLRKLAVSRLEVGDIVDFYQVFGDSTATDMDILSTPAEYYTFDYPFPILHQELVFRIGPEFHFHHNNYNGAPEIREKSEVGATERVFEVSQGPVPPVNRPDWSMYLLHEPYVKFQAYYVPSKGSIRKSLSFLNEEERIRRQITENDILELFHRYRKKARKNKDFKIDPPYGGLNLVFYREKANGDDPMGLTWSFYRYAWVDNPGINQIENEKAYEGFYSHKSSHYFECFFNILLRHKVPFSFVAVVPRALGGREEALLISDLGFAFEVDGTYYFTPSGHTPSGTIPADFQGGEGWKVICMGDPKDLKVIPITLPQDEYTKNMGSFSYEIDLDPDSDSLMLSRKATYHGWPSDYYQRPLLLDMSYLQDAPLRFQQWWPIGFWTWYGANQRQLNAFREEQIETRKTVSDSLLREDIESDFGEVGAVQTTLVKSGRIASSPELVFEQTFKTPHLLRKVGPNLMFDLGKLMGVQVAIREEDRERSEDVQMECARMYTTESHVRLPEGYSVEGLDAFNVSVDNEAGSFVSKAVFEEGEIIFTTEKIYKHAKVPAVHWPLMLEFIDLAHDVSQKKILIKQVR